MGNCEAYQGITTFCVSDILQQEAATSWGAALEYYPQDLSFSGNLAVSSAGGACFWEFGDLSARLNWQLLSRCRLGQSDPERRASEGGGHAPWLGVLQLSCVILCLFEAETVTVTCMCAMFCGLTQQYFLDAVPSLAASLGYPVVFSFTTVQCCRLGRHHLRFKALYQIQSRYFYGVFFWDVIRSNKKP